MSVILMLQRFSVPFHWYVVTQAVQYTPPQKKKKFLLT